MRKPRFSQQSSAMIIMLGGEAGRGAPIEHENEGEIDHSMALKNTEKGRQRKNKIQVKIQEETVIRSTRTYRRRNTRIRMTSTMFFFF